MCWCHAPSPWPPGPRFDEFVQGVRIACWLGHCVYDLRRAIALSCGYGLALQSLCNGESMGERRRGHFVVHAAGVGTTAIETDVRVQVVEDADTAGVFDDGRNPLGQGHRTKYSA